MKPTQRIWTRLAIGVGFAVLAFSLLCVWNKHSFCQAWADHYAARAKQLRTEATNPALGRDATREHLIAADLHDMISRKYATVASHPWRPYPGYPLVKPEEQQLVAGRR
jgi:hypothetical protein